MDAKQKAPRRTARSSRSEQDAGKYAIPIMKAVTIGLLITTVLLLLFALIMSKKDVPFVLINPLSIAALVAGAFAAGFSAARQLRERGLTVGALSGLILFVLLLIASALSHCAIGFLTAIKLIIAVIGGAIGGVLGVNVRIHRK